MRKREGYTTIWITLETHRQLRELKKYKAETMDSVLRRLIFKYKTGRELEEVVIWGKCYSEKRKKSFLQTSEKPKFSFY
jgi:predicted CopG family antitoxin